jgi:hypothetical protein
MLEESIRFLLRETWNEEFISYNGVIFFMRSTLTDYIKSFVKGKKLEKENIEVIKDQIYNALINVAREYFRIKSGREISISGKGHTFVNDMYYIGRSGEDVNFKTPFETLEFKDSTQRLLVNRLKLAQELINQMKSIKGLAKNLDERERKDLIKFVDVILGFLEDFKNTVVEDLRLLNKYREFGNISETTWEKRKVIYNKIGFNVVNISKEFLDHYHVFETAIVEALHILYEGEYHGEAHFGFVPYPPSRRAKF